MAQNYRLVRRPLPARQSLKEWEMELLGITEASLKVSNTRSRSERRKNERKVARSAVNSKLNQTSKSSKGKPKTAEAAKLARQNSASHKQGQGRFTRTGEFRKSRRSLKRSIYRDSSS